MLGRAFHGCGAGFCLPQWCVVAGFGLPQYCVVWCGVVWCGAGLGLPQQYVVLCSVVGYGVVYYGVRWM